MPELPEIRAQAERLAVDFVGRELTKFTALSFTALKTFQPDPAVAVGTRLVGVGSRGKYLLLRFDEVTFLVHLMQGGRLEPDAKQSAKPRGGLARWTFDADALLLTEAGKEHKAGIWLAPGDGLDSEVFGGLGPDADLLSVDDLGAILRAHSGRLHGLLRDQRQLAGLGRRLANEICHRAKVSPFANTAKLTDNEISAIHEAIGASIAESLEFESTQDRMAKSAQRPARVHHRAGEKCVECGDVIRAVKYNAYEVNYCASCQTAGKILADNTTSKFLK